MDPTIPNANSPVVLTRLLELIGGGVSSSQTFHEELGIEKRAVQYYRTAAHWLGFLESQNSNCLTNLGLTYVFDKQRRSETYRKAVWSQPFIAQLLETSCDKLPQLKDVTRAVQDMMPELSVSTARRRASAVRSLIAPAIGTGLSAEIERGRQLQMPFVMQPEEETTNPTIKISNDVAYSPDIYRFLYAALLDFGELTLAQIRALLDGAGFAAAPLDGYTEMMLERGDAHLFDGSFVISKGAIERSEMASNTKSIMLSHPGYRSLLSMRLQASRGNSTSMLKLRNDDNRFSTWDSKLFGGAIHPSEIDVALAGILMDRSLSSFPEARPGPPQPKGQSEPFLMCWDTSKALIIALPSTLIVINNGVKAVNSLFRLAREAPNLVNAPTIASRSAIVHGGILFPTEPLPRSVPDMRSLRVRSVLSSPYLSMTTALLLAHRLRPEGCSPLRRPNWHISTSTTVGTELITALDSFATIQGWVPSRHLTGGLTGKHLVEILVSLGIASIISDDICILSDQFFEQLRHEPEEMEMFEPLSSLGMTIWACLTAEVTT